MKRPDFQKKRKKVITLKGGPELPEIIISFVTLTNFNISLN